MISPRREASRSTLRPLVVVSALFFARGSARPVRLFRDFVSGTSSSF